MTILLPDPWPENDPNYEYIPDALGRLGRGIWRRRRRLDSFGRIAPDLDFERFRDEFDFKKPVGSLFRGQPFSLVAPVGREGENERFDVARIETLLAKLGFHDLRPTEGPTGYYGVALEEAIRKFQAAENLKVDGLINPDGPTLATLAKRVGETAAPERTRDEGGRDPDAADERRPVNLLEAAIRPRNPMIPPSPGEILNDGPMMGGGGSLRGRKPAPPPPIVPGADTGRPKGDGRDLPPPAESESRREAVADDFVKEITRPLEAHRGDETTKKGNDIVARECRQILEEDYPDLEEHIKHVGGATEDGEGESTLSEKYVPNKERKAQKLDARPGSSHPDLTWRDATKDSDDPSAHAHANTATMKKRVADGQEPEPISRERRSYERLVENVGEDLATMIPKLRPGMDEDDYRRKAREKCREVFGKWLGAPRKNAPNDDGNELSAP